MVTQGFIKPYSLMTLRNFMGRILFQPLSFWDYKYSKALLISDGGNHRRMQNSGEIINFKKDWDFNVTTAVKMAKHTGITISIYLLL